MFSERYTSQAHLLLRCLPEVPRQSCFALKGGTAINLFYRDMPRVSVDIDLTYLPLKARNEALEDIGFALRSIKTDIERNISGCQVREDTLESRVVKIHVATKEAVITIEPNLVLRGTVQPPETRDLTTAAQEYFGLFATARVLRPADLYGGKLCAALDRQHPRDLFDIKVLLDDSGITPGIRRAFVVYLAGHSRPMNELLSPRPKDITPAFHDQFEGMARQEVEIGDLIAVRDHLAETIPTSLDDNERCFLVSMKEGEPDWDVLGIPHLRELPALQWKLINIRKMPPQKRREALSRLKEALQM